MHISSIETRLVKGSAFALHKHPAAITSLGTCQKLKQSQACICRDRFISMPPHEVPYQIPVSSEMQLLCQLNLVWGICYRQLCCVLIMLFSDILLNPTFLHHVLVCQLQHC